MMVELLAEVVVAEKTIEEWLELEVEMPMVEAEQLLPAVLVRSSREASHQRFACLELASFLSTSASRRAGIQEFREISGYPQK